MIFEQMDVQYLFHEALAKYSIYTPNGLFVKARSFFVMSFSWISIEYSLFLSASSCFVSTTHQEIKIDIYRCTTCILYKLIAVKSVATFYFNSCNFQRSSLLPDVQGQRITARELSTIITDRVLYSHTDLTRKLHSKLSCNSSARDSQQPCVWTVSIIIEDAIKFHVIFGCHISILLAKARSLQVSRGESLRRFLDKYE